MHEIIWTLDKGCEQVFHVCCSPKGERSLRDSELVWGRSDDSKRHPLSPPSLRRCGTKLTNGTGCRVNDQVKAILCDGNVLFLPC